ncbi:HD domain-containing protein [Corynebacterium sp. TAE3-ERU12]|uniref:HD domain-containing protein n=1 Tax=Corynebacterium sp. TAE3-ERU12 TaxID=2849491 RepID=UPI001C486C59|nr:HD domain-containing protein [Corynebacterium sp. TAE3-ERU12]MBV7295206.1 HD domain-containing protein [Corynebacterium sp. TAE3-ERU12]
MTAESHTTHTGPAGPGGAFARELLDTISVPDGFALAATGSLARGEMTSYSDLDLTLLAAPGNSDAEIARVADSIWYPLWDSKMRIDHSVRTPDSTLSAAESDLTAYLALLDLTHLSGDAELTETTRTKLITQWRRGMTGRFDDLIATAASRWRRSGSVTAMTRPDLKHGRGGLRDHDLLRALALANLTDAPDLTDERTLVLDIRSRLHSAARRARDVLDPEFAEPIADELGYADRFELQRHLATAARTIDAALTDGTATARAALPRHTALRRPVRRPLDEGVVEHSGQVALARGAKLIDPGLPYRAAASAARTGLPVGRATWQRLKECPPLPTPWPSAVLADVVSILASDATIIRDLDRHGLWEPIVASWPVIRGLVPRERTHTHTVDEHTISVVREAAERRTRVARPDLLLLAALLHDIGKGTARPHAEEGADIALSFAKRAGLDAADTASLVTLVQQHQMLAELATTKNPQSPDTADELAHCLSGVPDPLLILDILTVLTEADSRGTGPGVWSAGRAAAMTTLAGITREHLSGATPQPPQQLAEPAKPPVDVEDWSVLLHDDAPDTMARLLHVIKASGYTALRCEAVFADNGDTRAAITVRPRHGGPPQAGVLRQKYRRAGATDVGTPPVHCDWDFTWRGSVLELRAAEAPGALATLVSKGARQMQWLRAATVAGTLVVLVEPRGEREALESALTDGG